VTCGSLGHEVVAASHCSVAECQWYGTLNSRAWADQRPLRDLSLVFQAQQPAVLQCTSCQLASQPTADAARAIIGSCACAG
jgi:hypothetical protein